jgi:hypothetical protein
LNIEGGEVLRESVVGCLNEVTGRRQQFFTVSDGLLIAIKPDQLPFGRKLLLNRRRVPAEAQSAVQINPVRLYREVGENIFL